MSNAFTFTIRTGRDGNGNETTWALSNDQQWVKLWTPEARISPAHSPAETGAVPVEELENVLMQAEAYQRDSRARGNKAISLEACERYVETVRAWLATQKVPR